METLTSEEIKSISEKTSSINNLGFFDKKIREKIFDLSTEYSWSSGDFCKALGNPTIVFKNLESKPGAWGWLEENSKVYFIYFNDCYKKNGYKGGSLEFYLEDFDPYSENPNQNSKNKIVLNALNVLLNHYKKLKDFKND